MLEAKLVVVGGDAKATEVHLQLPTVIGRGREATLTLPHPLVSRRHTEIFERDGQLCVRDLGSLNGTFVNNKRIEDEQTLAPNQLLTLGNVTFRAVYESPVFPEGTAGPESEIAVAPRADELSGQSLLETTPLSDIATAPAASNTPKAPIIEVTGNIAAGSGSAGAKTEADSDLENRDYRSSEPDAQRVDESTGSSVPVKPSVDYDTNDAAIVIDDVDALSPERSIAIQNLDQLPASTAPVSFVGSLNVDDAHSAASAIDAEAIQLDGPAHAAPVEPDQSGLGSFLKKLPR